jgi:hypothetical protein
MNMTKTLCLVAVIALGGVARAQATSSGAPPASAPDAHAAPDPSGNDTSAVPTAAPSEPVVVEAPAPKKRDRGEFLVAVKVGGLFPQAFSRLDSSYLVDLEVGWALPVLRHHLAITVEAAFTDPEADGRQADPRLDAAGGMYSWHLEQRELILGVNLIYRHPIGRLTPYVGVGPRLFLLESKVSGKAGTAKIATSSEQSTTGGAGIPVGLGIRLGPGDLFLEVALNISPITHTTTGDSNTGSISLALGYRLIF